jgi:hypothetical protein
VNLHESGHEPDPKPMLGLELAEEARTVLQSVVEHSVKVFMRSTSRRCRQGKHDRDLGHTDTCLVIRTCRNILECVITGAQT